MNGLAVFGLMDVTSATYLVLFIAGGGFAVLSWLMGTRGHDGHGVEHGHAAGAHGGKLALPKALVHAKLAALGHGAHGHGGAQGKAVVAPAKLGATDGNAAAASAATPAHAHVERARAHALLPWLLGRLFLPLVNVSALAAGACVGGGLGYLARRFGVTPIGSLAWSLPSGLGAAYGIAGVLGWLQRGTRYRQRLDPAGTVAVVLARMSERSTGEIAYVHEGARHSLPAVSASGRAIERDVEVVVLEVVNGVAKVTPSAELFSEEPS